MSTRVAIQATDGTDELSEVVEFDATMDGVMEFSEWWSLEGMRIQFELFGGERKVKDDQG